MKCLLLHHYTVMSRYLQRSFVLLLLVRGATLHAKIEREFFLT